MSEPPLIDIRPDHWEIVREILQRHVPDREVWAFGSRAKWTAKQYSDLDLCILGDEPLELGVLAGLEEDFSESDLPFKVDVVDWATISEKFRGIVERDRVVVQRVEVTGGILPNGTTPPRGLSVDLIRWPLIPAREIFELKYGKALIESNRRTGKVPVYGTNGQCGTHNESLFCGPGVIIGRKGQGPLGIEWCSTDYWVIDTAYRLLPIRSDIDLKYSYFLVKFIGLNHLKDGTSNPTLSRDVFGSQALPIPPLNHQRAIAAVLSALDDKIDLNRRMSADLEAMARALFKDWFVDFGPVRAKAEGRPAYLVPEIWDLFPGALDDEDKPVGWEDKTWGELAILEYGKRLTDYQDGNGPIPVFGTNGQIGWHSESLCNSEGIVIGRKGAYRGVHFSETPFFVIDTAFYLRPITSISVRWAYYTISRYDINEMDSGSAIPSTNRDAFYRLQVILPDKMVQSAFDQILSPIWKQRRSNSDESQTLAHLRDLLLPKLITGAIRVRDAEKAVENAL